MADRKRQTVDCRPQTNIDTQYPKYRISNTMTHSPIHRFHAIVKRITATPIVTRLAQPVIASVDRVILRLTRNRYSLTGLMMGTTIITLTTVGAKSGQPRSVPLVALEDGEKIVVIASNFGQMKHPAWYYNLRAHPEAALTLRGRTSVYVAHEADPDEQEHYWAQAISVYPGYAAYQVRASERRIPIFVLQPKPV
jgi:deazaflavin-dependent oxidoreductase (nitroreductase family)